MYYIASFERLIVLKTSAVNVSCKCFRALFESRENVEDNPHIGRNNLETVSRFNAA